MTAPEVGVLLGYLYWLRDRVAQTAVQLEPARFLETPSLKGRDLRATLAHELDVEHSWRPKLRGEPMDAWGPSAEIRASEFMSLDALMTRWRFDEAEMRDWVGGLSDDDLDAPVTTNGLEGRSLATYLTHVIEHGVTELTMASAILGEMGLEMGELGFLAYLDETAPAAEEA
jgi:uncharacterized damage-inducible protein DinB